MTESVFHSFPNTLCILFHCIRKILVLLSSESKILTTQFWEVPCLVLLCDPLHKLIPGHFLFYIAKICMYHLAQRISWVEAKILVRASSTALQFH